MKTVLVAGTWGERQEEDWWRPGSPFIREAQRNGVELLDPFDPFRWPTELEGVWGSNLRWELAGKFLLWYCHAKAPWERVNLFGHSHAAQVIANALAMGLLADTVVMAAGPVRKDTLPIYEAGAKNLRRWVHIHTGKGDVWQYLGALGSGWWPWSVPRRMPAPAENIYEPGQDHASLLDPALWTARGWWNFVKDAEGVVA